MCSLGRASFCSFCVKNSRLLVLQPRKKGEPKITFSNVPFYARFLSGKRLVKIKPVVFLKILRNIKASFD